MSNLKMMTDDMLVKLYADGNNEAFDMLLERYKDKVFSHILYHVHCEDKANDIFQETFVKVITCIRGGKYVENGKFAAWLMRIAHNLTIDHFRQKQNERWVSDDEYEGELFGRMQLAVENPEHAAINQQTLDNVLLLMQDLPENQRDIVKKRLFDDMSFKEIADQTGVSINTALGRMRYALLNMRKRAETSRLSYTFY